MVVVMVVMVVVVVVVMVVVREQAVCFDAFAAYPYADYQSHRYR